MSRKGEPSCNACRAAPDGICANRCPATSKQTGKRCGSHLAKGAVVCGAHGGRAGQVLAAQSRRVAEIELRTELTRMGVAVLVDPGEALLEMVYEAAGNVAYLRSLVAQLRDPVIDPRPGDGILSKDGDADVDTDPTVRGTLYGRIKPDTFEAKPHVLVVMYDAERDRLATCAALAVRAGVEERRVRMAEATTDRLFSAVTIALAAAGLAPAQQEAFRLALAAALRVA